MSKSQVNGTADASQYIDSIDPDDPEYLRQLRRPAEVKQDVRQMEDRQRVHRVLNSKTFRSELERLVDERIKSGEPCPPSLIALQQQISGLNLPQSRLKHGALVMQGNGPVIPISNFKNDDATFKSEKLLHCKLASCYRLVDMFGWAQGSLGIITAAIGSDLEQYIAAPAGIQFHEVTASCLVKVNSSGSLVDSASMSLAPTKATFSLAVAMHAARNDVKSVVFLCHPSAVSVSAMRCGLLPLCHDAMALGEVPFCDVDGDQQQLSAAIGSSNKVVFLRNRGVLVGGESIEEAFHLLRRVMIAVDTQMRTVPLGLDNIVLPSDATRRRTFEAANQTLHAGGDSSRHKWRVGELEFEALMRRLENAGHRTGYSFHDALVRRTEKHDRVNAEVEVPPTLTAVALHDEEWTLEQKSEPRVDWVCASSAYKKEEIDQPGAPRAKKITKWVPDAAPGHVVKIDNANQFAPVGSNPKELRDKFYEIRKDYYDENIKAGPQSRILEGVTWEEAQKIREGNVQSDTVIVVGAASRAIIQRGHENTAAMYKTYYAPNPFDNITEEDVEEYKEEIQRKTRGEVTTDEEVLTPGPDGRLISTDERMQQVRQAQSESPAPASTDAYTTETETADTSGRVSAGSPTATDATPEKKKKKRGFRMPSFSSKKKDK